MDELTRNNIRYIFLSPRSSFALMPAAELLGMTLKELRKEIASGAIVAGSTRLGQRVAQEEMVAAAMRTWEQAVIKEARRGRGGGVARGDPARGVAGAHSAVSAGHASGSRAAERDVGR